MRGTGTTTQQMVTAPRGAVYVWMGGPLEYPQRLARELGRQDLVIERPSVLDRGAERLLGRELTGIVLDHALELSDEQFERWQALRWCGHERRPERSDG